MFNRNLYYAYTESTLKREYNDKMYNKNFSKKGWFLLDKKRGK